MQTSVPSKTQSIYGAITDKIVETMQADIGSYKMPWHTSAAASTPVNAATLAHYRGINVLSLWIDAQSKGYASGFWASYRQWQKLGAQVRKGERGSPIVFYKPLEKIEEPDSHGDRRRFVIRSSQVFNSLQVEGWEPPPTLDDEGPDSNEQVAGFISAVAARVRYGFNKACYRRDLDDIEMPSPAWFTGCPTSPPLQAFYAVLLHELTHWTGATHRLNREFGKRFGDHAYAFEELIAELGAAFLCAELGVSNEPRLDHAIYLKSWLTVLGSDAKAIFLAASRAQEAAEFLNGQATSMSRKSA